MVDIKEVAENIYMIDQQIYSISKWGSVYLINEEKKALVDAGPTTSANRVLDGIRGAGVSPEDIDYVIVTHIHLDHAGGAGVLIKHMPQAQVIVHYRGVKHMVNPARLVSSMLAAQGEEAMVRYGEMVPIAADQVKPVYEGDVLRLSKGQLLRFLDAPGHAPHELCIHESRNQGVFTGGAAGLYAADEVLLPITPPPSFNTELYIDTLERLMALEPAAIYFAHFGVSNTVQESLKSVRDKLLVWDDMVAEAIKKNKFDGVMEKIKDQTRAELKPVRKMESLYKYLTGFFVPLNIAGFSKYYQEKYEAR